jgi:hypothetical protein
VAVDWDYYIASNFWLTIDPEYFGNIKYFKFKVDCEGFSGTVLLSQ